MIVVVLVAAGWLLAVILKFVTCLSVMVFVATVLTVLIHQFDEVAGVVHMSQEQRQIYSLGIYLGLYDNCYLMYLFLT